MYGHPLARHYSPTPPWRRLLGLPAMWLRVLWAEICWPELE